jgi:hypothetical protein
MAQEIPCKVCEAGRLQRRRRYRMSGIVVLIGYILLIPSVIGMASATVTCAGTGAAVETASRESQDDARNALMTASIPPDIVERVLSMETLSDSTRARLTREQQRVVDDTRLELSATTLGTDAGAAVVGLGSAFIFVTSLVGGLLGWLLVMKKTILQCNRCGAAVAAS